MTPGPLHYAVNAPPTTFPPSPSPAATPEADPQASAPTHLGLTQTLQRHCPRGPGAPTPNLAPNTTHLWPHWPANPPSTLLSWPIADHPPAPFPTPLPPPWAAPPTVPDAPASPVPPTLALAPHTLRCSTPTLTPPSLPALHFNPPLPIKAPLPMPSMPPLAPPPACEGRPLVEDLLLGPTPNGGEALRFPWSAAEDTPSPCPPHGGPTCPADHPMLTSPNIQYSMPTPANSDTFLANSDGPLAHSNIFPAATSTFPGLPEPLRPLPAMPDPITRHQLDTPAPSTYSGISQQPQNGPHHN
ncbi:hypothetical protein E4T56_gene10254 [Termitomyces sp. T112]|nr:hypothetical protein E4T56_gene10254 [Termitomyces sp. T112]